MGKLLRNNSVNNAEIFIKDVARENYYVYYALAGEWPVGVNPETVVDTDEQEQLILENILYGVQAAASDVQLVVNRVPWVLSNVYEQYNVSKDYFTLQDAPLIIEVPNFYIVTDELKVYKCIYNAKNSPSTIKPISTDTQNVFQTSDNYIWKYLFTVPAVINAKFGDQAHLPVTPNTAVASAAIPGAIHVIEVANTGTGYFEYNQGNLQNIVNAYAVVLSTTARNVSNFYKDSTFYLTENNSVVNRITSYDGTTRVATLANPLDIVASFEVANTVGFIVNDLVNQTINQNENLSGKILYIDTEGARINFTHNTSNRFLIGETLTQTTPIASGIIASANNTYLRLVQVAGNFIANSMIIGSVSAATANTTVVAGINSIAVATNTTRWSPTNALVRTSATTTNTSISSVQITPETSASYIVSPRIDITGNGLNAAAVAIANTITGVINSISVVNPGRGYTHATATINTNNQNSLPALLNPILSPFNGHGANVVRELGASTVALSVDTKLNEERKILSPGSFRSVGILKNPFFDKVSFVVERYDTIFLPFSSSVGTFQVGEYVYQPSTRATGFVRNVENGIRLTLSDVLGVFQVGSSIIGNISTAEAIAGAFEKIFFQPGTKISQENTQNVATVLSANSSIIRATAVSGRFSLSAPLVSADSNIIARTYISQIRNVNNRVTNFKIFSSVVRLPIHSNLFAFNEGDVVQQATSNAKGTIINSSVDLVLDTAVALLPGSTVRQNSPFASGIVLTSENGYTTLVNVKNTFVSGSLIITTFGTSTVVSVYPVLYLSNNTGTWVNSSEANYMIRNLNNGIVGFSTIPNTIRYPEVSENGGNLLYIENVESIVKTDLTNETFKLYVKF